MQKVESQIKSECFPCLFRQILTLSDLVGLKEPERKLLIKQSMEYLLENDGNGIVVQHAFRKATDDIIAMRDLPSNYDPYEETKLLSNDMALSHYSLFKKMVRDSESPMETAVKLAAAGNVIDFGATDRRDLDIEEELKNIEKCGFGIYQYNDLFDELNLAESILYICDNAGEILLDRVFIEEIRNTFPDLPITCALRHKPVINDAVLKDALYVGLDQSAKLISSGSIYPGTILSETSDEFKEHFNKADLIISKGQGNFETLLESDNNKIFFILKIKCAMMADLSGCNKGDLVLMRNSP